jgi:hypothetical protein
MEANAGPLPVTRGRPDRLAHNHLNSPAATAVLQVVLPAAAAADRARPANPVVSLSSTLAHRAVLRTTPASPQEG